MKTNSKKVRKGMSKADYSVLEKEDISNIDFTPPLEDKVYLQNSQLKEMFEKVFPNFKPFDQSKAGNYADSHVQAAYVAFVQVLRETREKIHFSKVFKTRTGPYVVVRQNVNGSIVPSIRPKHYMNCVSAAKEAQRLADETGSTFLALGVVEKFSPSENTKTTEQIIANENKHQFINVLRVRELWYKTVTEFHQELPENFPISYTENTPKVKLLNGQAITFDKHIELYRFLKTAIEVFQERKKQTQAAGVK